MRYFSSSLLIELSCTIELLLFAIIYFILKSYLLYSCSYSTLEVGRLSGISLTDADNNDEFQIHSATISLSGDSDMTYERISVSLDNSSPPTNGINIVDTSMQYYIIWISLFIAIFLDTRFIYLSGMSNLSNYQSVLSSLVYRNERFEPSPSNRTISLYVNDGSFNSNTVSITITISLVNDNPLVLSCSPSFLYYKENINSDGTSFI